MLKVASAQLDRYSLPLATPFLLSHPPGPTAFPALPAAPTEANNRRLATGRFRVFVFHTRELWQKKSKPALNEGLVSKCHQPNFGGCLTIVTNHSHSQTKPLPQKDVAFHFVGNNIDQVPTDF